MPTKTEQVLEMLPQILALTSTAAKLFSGSVTGAGTVGKYLDVLAVVVAQGQHAYNDLVSLRELVQVMVNEQREPTNDEWRVMEQRSLAAYDRIQNYNIDAE